MLAKIIEKIRLMGFHSNRIEFYQDLARSIDKKELLPSFLSAEMGIAKSKGTKDSSKAFAMESMLRILRDGDDVSSIAKTVGRYMPHSDQMLLAAVDEAKNDQKAETLRSLAFALQEQSEGVSTIRKAILVPLAVVPAIAAFVYVIATRLLPIVEKIAPPEVWTAYNEAVRTVVKVLFSNGFYILSALTIFLVAFFSALPKWRSNIRYRLERVDPAIAVLLTPIAPWLLPLAIYRDFQAGMVMTALAVILKTGKPLTTALEMIRDASNPYMRRHIQRILSHLDDKPTAYAEAFSKGLLSPRLNARLASIIRNEPKFENVIIEVGTVGVKEIRGQVNKSAFKLNMMFLAIGAVAILFLYTGQMSISNSMKNEMDPIKQMQRRSLRAQQAQQPQQGGGALK